MVGNADRAPFHGAGPGPLCVGDDAVAHLPGKVQSFAVFFQHIHHPQALPVVGKAAGAELIQRPLPRMTEWGMPQVMAQGDGLGQVLVQAQGPGNGAGNLGHLQRVGQSGAVMVPFRREKDLGFLLQPPKRLAVDDPVPVPLEAGTAWGRAPPAGGGRGWPGSGRHSGSGSGARSSRSVRGWSWVLLFRGSDQFKCDVSDTLWKSLPFYVPLGGFYRSIL